MKVKELIERLQALDPELEVMRNGYEGGVENVTLLDIESVALNVFTAWYYGSHEVVYKDDKHPGHEIISAVVIS
jgi:hypothetical protein